MSYLSIAPEGLREALVTGGLAPLGPRIDDVYRATYARTLERGRRYYERYPGDRDRVLALREHLQAHDVRLPSGDRLTPRRVQQLGGMLGMSDGAEGLHYILELPVDSPAFRHDVDAALGFARNPLYAVLQEACWADGGATRWAAQRLLPSAYEAEPELFFGEHVYPWMFEDYGALAPLREAADILAAHEWPRLYDPDRLAANEVPVAAAIYAEDMYVERAFSEETAGPHPRLAALAHQRARAQRPARRRRAHPGAPHRPRAREGVRMAECNWAGTHVYGAATLHRPGTREQVREIVARAPRVRVLGSRHSFSDIADSAELVSLEGLPADVTSTARRAPCPAARR